MNRRPPNNQIFQTTDRITVERFAEITGMTVWEIDNLRSSGLGPPQHRTHTGEKFYLGKEVRDWIARQSEANNFGGGVA